MKRFLPLLILLPGLALADAPVSSVSAVNANQSAQSDQNAALLQQTQNLVQMNLPQQMAQLKQSVQDLRGVVEMQGHEIAALSKAMSSLTGKQLPTDDSSAPDASSTSSSDASSSNNVGNLSGTFEPAMGQMMSTSLTKNQQQQMVDAKNSQAQSSNNNSDGSQSTNSQDGSTAGAQNKETALYQSAVSDIQAKNYTKAMTEMQGYLSQYPAGQYAANAHYWLGELNMISGNNQEASDEFNTVVSDYPKSDKVSDAMWKIGMLAMANQDYKSAKQTFQAIVKKYPNSSAARLANKELDQLNQAGY